MKVILVNERLGHTRTYVIKGWLKGVLSLCLLGAPVALGYLGYQLSLQQAESGEAVSCDAAVHHSLRGTTRPAEVRLSECDDASLVAVLAPSSADGPSCGADSSLLAIDLQPSTAAPSPYAVQPSRSLFRHGRSIDPATYQRRVYS